MRQLYGAQAPFHDGLYSFFCFHIQEHHAMCRLEAFSQSETKILGTFCLMVISFVVVVPTRQKGSK